MLTNNPALDEVLSLPQDHDVDFVRFCLSDNAPVRILNVVDGDSTPVDYAKAMMKQGYKGIFAKYLHPKLNGIEIPKIVAKAWTYDRLIMAALFVRIVAMRRSSLKDVEGLLSVSRVFLTSLDTRSSPLSKYAGLCDIAQTIFHHSISNGAGFIVKNTEAIGHLDNLTTHLSDITQPDWIFHDPDWVRAVLENERRLKLFRLFIHVTLVSFGMEDQAVDLLYDLKRQDLYDLIDDFTALRTNKDTTVSDINNFFQILGNYITVPGDNQFFASLFRGKFKLFREMHVNAYQDKFATPV